MDIWHINGGRRLEGICFVQGSKNAALPIIAASIVSPAESELMNVPQLSDVDASLRILRRLGCTAEQDGNDVYIDSSGLCGNEIPHSLMAQMRSSVMFLGALTARCGHARLCLPGGCRLGKRPIDMHLAALRQMGAQIEEHGGEIICHAPALHGAEIFLPFPSVGATENIMLAAVRAKGRTVIHGAAKEPEIVALQDYLRCLGAEVFGAGSDAVTISGFVPRKSLQYTMIPDRIAAATLACAAAATGGNVEMRGVDSAHFSTVLHFLNRAGCDIIQKNRFVRIVSPERLRAAGRFATAPYPGFPTDAQPVLMAAMMKAAGRTTITETIFENRFRQVPELIKLGADITLSGQTAEVCGVEALRGAVLNSTDLRGGAAMIVGGLCAEGETVLLDDGHVGRGYERLDLCLRALGADVFIDNKRME